MGDGMGRARDVDALWARVISAINVAQAAVTRQTMIEVGQTDTAITLGGTQQVDVTWQEPFLRPYRVNVIALQLRGRATAVPLGLGDDGLATNMAGVSILVTAGLIVPAGSQFLVLGRT